MVHCIRAWFNPFLLLCAFIICIVTVVPAVAHIQLSRDDVNLQGVPGEHVKQHIFLHNTGDTVLQYTLIEEVAPDLTVTNVPFGDYNQLAGFIIWRGTIEPGSTESVLYEAYVHENAVRTVPMYAYVSTDQGDIAEHETEFTVLPIHWKTALDTTLVRYGEKTTFRIQLTNPLSRSVEVRMQHDVSSHLVFDAPFPEVVWLAPRETKQWELGVASEQSGRYSITTSVYVGDIEISGSKKTTLTVRDGEALAIEDLDYEEDDKDIADDQSLRIERTHSISIPDDIVQSEEEILLLVQLPDDARIVPNTVRTTYGDVEEWEQYDELAYFVLPQEEHVEVTYHVIFQNRKEAAVGNDRSQDDVALVSFGRATRTIAGNEELLQLFYRERPIPPRERVGLVIMHPADKEVFTQRDTIEVEVDGPMDAWITLYNNGQLISSDHIGAESRDDHLGRNAFKYIAVPLRVGENVLEARAVLADGDILEDVITVYRSGAPHRVEIAPVTDLITDRLEPHIFEVRVSDEHGLPPPDGTIATVNVQHGTLLNADVRPDWIGHQVELINGHVYLEIEPSEHSVPLRIAVAVGELEYETEMRIIARADEWFTIGHGQVEVSGLFNNTLSQPTVSTTGRMFVRGPVGDGVFTGRYDSTGLEIEQSHNRENPHAQRTEGEFGQAQGTLFARLEKELSYIQWGYGGVPLESRLTPYDARYTGIQFETEHDNGIELRGMYAQTPRKTEEFMLRADGTRYYNMNTDTIRPGSELVSIVVKDRSAPYDVIKETALRPGEYRIDYNTGQIFLSRPVQARDDDGNTQFVRVRVVLRDQDVVYDDVAGLQILYTHDQWYMHVLGAQIEGEYGVPKRALAAGVERSLGKWNVSFEVAQSENRNGIGRAYIATAEHPDVAGWHTRLTHRNIDGLFKPLEEAGTVGTPGSFTTVRSQRRIAGTQIVVDGSIGRGARERELEGEASVGLSWRTGAWRPRISLDMQGKSGKPIQTAVTSGIKIDLGGGLLAAERVQSLSADVPHRNIVEGRYDIGRDTSVQVVWKTSSSSSAFPEGERSLSWNVMQTFGNPELGTTVKGGYELSTEHQGIQQAMTYSVETHWEPWDNGRITLSARKRNPLLRQKQEEFGGALTWNQKTGYGESELRIDRYSNQNSTKQSVQWTGRQPLYENGTVYFDVLWSQDAPGNARVHYSIDGEYRDERLIILGGIAVDHRKSKTESTSGREGKVHFIYLPMQRLTWRGGYAIRHTDAPTTTDKFHAGVSWDVTPHITAHAEASLLRQHDSETATYGGRMSLSRRLTDDMWMTVGYAFNEFVGLDTSGPEFSRTQPGVYIGFDIAL